MLPGFLAAVSQYLAMVREKFSSSSVKEAPDWLKRNKMNKTF